LAAVWQLPVVFVCQNNEYGEFTPRVESQRVEIAKRAAAYDMPGVAVDGNDASDTYGAVAAAVDQARRGGGPTLIDAKTYRFMGHFYGDSMTYMDKDDLGRRMADDPVDRLRGQVIHTGRAGEADLAAIEGELVAEVEAAVAAAMAAPPPDPSEIFDDVYAEVY
jgi:pyruvate dehydrogenase E1 component alpha subunit